MDMTAVAARQTRACYPRTINAIMAVITNDIEYVLATARRAIAVHGDLRQRVDFRKHDRAHAVYLLQGGCLTNVVVACDHYSRGHQNHVMQTIRFVFEARALTVFFADVRDDDRRLRAWFEGKIVKAPSKPGRWTSTPSPLGIPPKEPKELEAWKTKAMAQFDDACKTIYDEYSKSQHPTIDAVRFNQHQGTHEFNYDCSALTMRPLVNLDLETGLLIPALQALWCGLKLQLLSRAESEAIRELIRNTEIRARGWSVLDPPRPASSGVTMRA